MCPSTDSDIMELVLDYEAAVEAEELRKELASQEASMDSHSEEITPSITTESIDKPESIEIPLASLEELKSQAAKWKHHHKDVIDTSDSEATKEFWDSYQSYDDAAHYDETKKNTQ
jgi:hypothetical protein